MRPFYVMGTSAGIMLAVGGVAAPAPTPQATPLSHPIVVAGEIAQLTLTYIPRILNPSPHQHHVSRVLSAPTDGQAIRAIIVLFDALQPNTRVHSCAADQGEGALIVINLRDGRSLTGRYDLACDDVMVRSYPELIDPRWQLWNAIVCQLMRSRRQHARSGCTPMARR